MRSDRDKHRASPVMVLKTLVLDRQFLRSILSAVFQRLRELGQVGICASIVDGRGDMTGDREQDMEILFRTRLVTAICSDKSQRLVVGLQRNTHKGLHSYAAGQFEKGRLHAMGYR